jgi:NADH-quinone oxidoreductase subunit C
MDPAALHQRLVSRFGDKIIALNTEAIDPWIEVAPAAILEVCAYMKSEPDLAFDSLNNLCGVDYFEPDAKKAAKFGHEPHLEVVCHLFSYTHRHKITLKVKLPRSNPSAADLLPEVPSIAGLYSIADWHERECYDLFGIRFINHPNLRRILCPEDWEGYPLRKDYDFPLEYHGVRGK